MAGKMPESFGGTEAELLTSRFSEEKAVQLADVNVAELTENAIVAIGGRPVFQVPKRLPADLDSAAMVAEAFARPRKSDLLVQLVQQGLSGEPLLKKWLSQLSEPFSSARRWFEKGACFAAGTLVHTKEGLKPIEQIQVGEWVLSKPENGGEQAYKRVIKTYAHPPERVVQLLHYMQPSDVAQATSSLGLLIVTPSHPVWTDEEGWTAVGQMQGYGATRFNLQGKDGEKIPYFTIRNIFVSEHDNVGWMSSSKTSLPADVGTLWNFVEHKLVATNVPPMESVAMHEHPDPYFKLPVYNLEVEDFHTYYVGEQGIWVHNENCGGWIYEISSAQPKRPRSLR